MLSNICTDLTTSQKLKKLGIEAETCFAWSLHRLTRACVWDVQYTCRPILKSSGVKAYTLEQIWGMLPAARPNNNKYQSYSDLQMGDDFIGYPGTREEYMRNGGESLATTAARLLIKLKEEGLV